MEALPLPRVPFYFTRHGETDWNKKGLITGQQDIPLNTQGKEQALSQAPLLTTLKVTALIASPLLRARETAKFINLKAKLPIIYEEGLKERFWALWEGTPHNKRLSELKNSKLPERAEIYLDFEKRVFCCVKKILWSHPPPVLIVAHAGTFLVVAKLVGQQTYRAKNSTIYHFTPPGRTLALPWNIEAISSD